jgi:uncharacterized protein YkwD
VVPVLDSPCRRAIPLLLLGGWISVPACSASSAPTMTDSASADPSPFEHELGLCVQRMNTLRASKGLAPFGRDATLERYAAAAARTDGLAHTPHRHARETRHGNGVARAENEILWWSLDGYGSVEAIIEGGLDDMWRQGAGGAHYDNLVGPYKQAGCGIFVNRDEVTVVQAFR